MLLATLIDLLAHERTLETRRPSTERTTSPAPVYRFVARPRGAKVSFRCAFDRPHLCPCAAGFRGFAFDGTSFWAANYDDSRLIRLDPGTGRTLASWSTDGGPRDVLLAFGSVWIANSRGSTVLRLQP
jgi:hypothetical protein